MTGAPVRVGVIGAGLMGREAAVAIARWPALADHPVRPRLEAVCDLDPGALAWFDRIEGVRLRTVDYHDLLADPDLDVIYIALPHHLHEQVYRDAADAGKDFLAEKPFGIDLAAAERIVAAVERAGVFVRCSSEMPFFPGALVATELVRSGAVGRVIEAHSSFLHSSDLNLDKPVNWKRRVATCGQIGVMGDLGMHAVHVPFRLGWAPGSVYAVLQDLVPERPDGHGGRAPCDTFDNATLHTRVQDAAGWFPLTFETKRIAVGEMNTWRLRVLGMDGGVEFSTRSPQIVRRFRVDTDGRQVWEEVQPGNRSAFATITGAIFEFGFADAILQMWAAFLAERAGALGDALGCVTPAEALASHRLFDAALRSHASGRSEPVPG
ncbi:MAG: Gfo/Idh/MocA family oxidoreductase [Euzebyales bacterium]|jgi:predicted dehydrogenase|nr:Gfo/Idh/MocA family oxidoreductase [Euzebyales bacterium]